MKKIQVGEVVYRYLYCDYYDRCLNFAAAQNWNSFTCEGCKRQVGVKYLPYPEVDPAEQQGTYFVVRDMVVNDGLDVIRTMVEANPDVFKRMTAREILERFQIQHTTPKALARVLRGMGAKWKYAKKYYQRQKERRSLPCQHLTR